MSDYLKIELIGRDGSVWCISGPGMGAQGVTLNPKMEQFYDAPVKTYYVPGPFGEEYAGKRPLKREMVLAVQAYDDDPETWMSIDAAWRWAFDYDTEATIRVTTSDGVRTLNVRLMEAPKPYNDNDPFITRDNPVVMTLAATFPYWRAEDNVFTWQTFKQDDFVKIPVHNDGDVPVWPRWLVTAPADWILPDFSFGNDMYGRGAADLGRTIPLPSLQPGEHCEVNADPRYQTIISANTAPVQNRWKGNDLLYPIMDGKQAELPVWVHNAPQGAALKLTVPRWYSRPFSRPGARL